jgi:hypothetical protein
MERCLGAGRLVVDAEADDDCADDEYRFPHVFLCTFQCFFWHSMLW